MRSPRDFPSLQHILGSGDTSSPHERDDPPILQRAVRAQFLNEVPGQWTTLREHAQRGPLSIGRYAALAPKRTRAERLKRPSWDLMIGQGTPGFTQYFSGQRRRTSYSRLSDDGGVEPIVHVRHFHKAKPGYAELSEEFRMFHNLYSAADGTLIRIDDDGYEYPAATVTPDLVRVDTGLLRQYQAARQLDLLLYIDAKYMSETEGQVGDTPGEDVATDLARTTFNLGDIHGKPFSRFLGKRVIPPLTKREAGVWPYQRPEQYLPFIIGVDANGRDIEHTCDPSVLADYFGGNPGAPHYLTGVYFSRDVLQKYYDQPEKFIVEDGDLRCLGLWSLRLDNNHPDYVVVHLGDLGRDLPERERSYWRSFNIRPAGGMSETAIRRAFLGQFASAQAPDLVFRSLYGKTRERWAAHYGWELWRSPNPGDEHILQGVRIPTSQPEFDRQLVSLARLLIDALNDDELASRTMGLAGSEKSIAKLEAWLRQESYPYLDRDVPFLRDLQELRSAGGAHRKGHDFGALLLKRTGSATPREAMERLLSDAISLLRDMAASFGCEGG
jgi:hypothetical protein